MDLSNLPTILYKNRFLIILTVSLAIVAFILFNFSVLVINVAGETQGITFRKNPEQGAGGKKARAGINILQRGTYFIEAKNEYSETTAYPTVKLFRLNRLELTLNPQAKIEKITENKSTANCVFGNIKGIYYVCKDGEIVRKSLGSVAPGVRVFQDYRVSGNPASYKNGVLAFVSREDGNPDEKRYRKLAFINPEGVRIIEDEAAPYIGEYGGEIITNSDQSFFGINNSTSRQLYVFTNDRSPPAVYDYKFDLGNHVISPSIRMSMDPKKIYLAFADSSEHSEGDIDHSEDLGRLKLLVLNWSSGSPPERTSTLELPENVNNASLVNVIDNNIFAHDGVTGELVVLNMEGEKINILTRIPNVPATAVVGERYYYVKDNRLYLYSPKEVASHLVSSSELSIASLFGFGQQLVFTGTPFKSLTKPATYFVTTGNRPVSGYLFDVLPYDLNDLPLLSSDYSGSTIVFNVKLDSQVFYRDGGQTFNQREFDLKKQMLLRRLKTDGIDTSKYRVEFIPGP